MQEFEITLETAPGKTELVLIPEQTKLEQIAKQYQKNYSDRIVLACVDGKLRELSKVVKAPGKISFLTMTDRDGKRTYRRSMTLLLQKAVENLWKDQVKIRVYYSLGESYYCELHGTANDAAAVQALRAEMQRLVEADLPIKKCSVKTEDAEQLFHDKGMKDKERLLHYRRSSRVNIYELDIRTIITVIWFHPRDTSECLIWSYMKTALFFCSQIKREMKWNRFIPPINCTTH